MPDGVGVAVVASLAGPLGQVAAMEDSLDAPLREVVVTPVQKRLCCLPVPQVRVADHADIGHLVAEVYVQCLAPLWRGRQAHPVVVYSYSYALRTEAFDGYAHAGHRPVEGL